MGNYVAIGLRAKGLKAKSSVITVSSSNKIDAKTVSVTWRNDGSGELRWTGDINQNANWQIGNTYFAEFHLKPEGDGKLREPNTGDDLGQVTVTIDSTPATVITLENQPLIHDP